MKRFIWTTVFGVALVALVAWEIDMLWHCFRIEMPYWYQILELGACAPVAAFCGEKASKITEWIKARRTNKTNRYISKDLA